jgi:hypothetical protein
VSSFNERHLSECGTCARAVQEPPRPFDADLCHTDIRPGDGWDDRSPIQCPHLRWQDSQLCGAAGAYAQLTGRTAPFN